MEGNAKGQEVSQETQATKMVNQEMQATKVVNQEMQETKVHAKINQKTQQKPMNLSFAAFVAMVMISKRFKS